MLRILRKVAPGARFAISGVAALVLGSACSSRGDDSEAGDQLRANIPRTGDPCLAVRAAIQPAVERTLASAYTRDAGVGVITARCGFVGVTAGPSGIAPDALYRIGSISKTHTAAMVLDLVKEGALRLDETIARFALGVPDEDRITVRQLLNHSSGLYNYTDDSEFPSHHDWTPRQRLAAAAAHAHYFEPGTDWHYSNTNYIALGLIAEQLGHADAVTLIRERVLVPHGLRDTFFAGAEPLDDRLAPSFTRQGTPIAKADGLIGAWTDGALAATLEDTTRWMRIYASGQATPAVGAELFDGVSIPHTPITYSLALFNMPPAVTGDVAAHGHGGDIPGFHSWSMDLPERGWTITAIVNQDGGDPNAFLIAVRDTLKACTSSGEC